MHLANSFGSGPINIYDSATWPLMRLWICTRRADIDWDRIAAAWSLQLPVLLLHLRECVRLVPGVGRQENGKVNIRLAAVRRVQRESSLVSDGCLSCASSSTTAFALPLGRTGEDWRARTLRVSAGSNVTFSILTGLRPGRNGIIERGFQLACGPHHVRRQSFRARLIRKRLGY